METPSPPPVQVRLRGEEMTAALLAWGRHEETGAWVAGVAYLHHHWHSRALITVWVPADLTRAWERNQAAGDYRNVARVQLSGPPSAWPPLPARYPGATEEWLNAHCHHADYRTAPVWVAAPPRTERATY